jgi:hypothetical protein
VHGVELALNTMQDSFHRLMDHELVAKLRLLRTRLVEARTKLGEAKTKLGDAQP